MVLCFAIPKNNAQKSTERDQVSTQNKIPTQYFKTQTRHQTTSQPISPPKMWILYYFSYSFSIYLYAEIDTNNTFYHLKQTNYENTSHFTHSATPHSITIIINNSQIINLHIVSACAIGEQKCAKNAQN